MTLFAVLLVLGVLGCGLVLAYRAFAEPAATLDATLARSQQTWRAEPTSLLDRMVIWVETMGSTLPSTDLEVLGWTDYDWHRRRIIFVLTGGLIGALLVIGARLVVSAFPVVLVITIAVAIFGALGLVVVEGDRASKAAVKRTEIRTALNQFLELTSIMLAGGAGAETALERASVHGHGRGFDMFAREIARAKEDPRLSAFTALRDLGHRLDINELIEFGNVMILSSENSATVRQALDDKAGLIVMREHERRRADAMSRNVWMSLPVVGMAGGFILWLMYAALAGLNSF